MILTCPRCSARYAVGTAKIPTGGRTVRCIACGHKWTARRGDGELEPWEEAPPPPPAPKIPEAPPVLIPEPEPLAPDAFEDLEPMIPPPVSGRKGKGAGKSGLSSRLVWAGLAAVLALIAVGVALFRNPIVSLWPKTAALYAAAGSIMGRRRLCRRRRVGRTSRRRGRTGGRRGGTRRLAGRRRVRDEGQGDTGHARGRVPDQDLEVAGLEGRKGIDRLRDQCR